MTDGEKDQRVADLALAAAGGDPAIAAATLRMQALDWRALGTVQSGNSRARCIHVAGNRERAAGIIEAQAEATT